MFTSRLCILCNTYFVIHPTASVCWTCVDKHRRNYLISQGATPFSPPIPTLHSILPTPKYPVP